MEYLLQLKESLARIHWKQKAVPGCWILLFALWWNELAPSIFAVYLKSQMINLK